jgi:hypothetical protein
MKYSQSALFKAKQDREAFAELDVVSVNPGANSASVLSIGAPGIDWLVVPTHFRIFASVPEYYGLSALLQGPCREDMAGRHAIIRRTDAQGASLGDVVTPLDYRSDFERSLDLAVEVGGLSSIQSLANTGLEITFNEIRSDERQYILCNYKVVRAAEEV